MSLRKVGDPVAVAKQGGSFYILVPVYIQNRVEMRRSLSTIKGCEAQWLEDTETHEFLVSIKPKKAGAK